MSLRMSSPAVRPAAPSVQLRRFLPRHCDCSDPIGPAAGIYSRCLQSSDHSRCSPAERFFRPAKHSRFDQSYSIFATRLRALRAASSPGHWRLAQGSRALLLPQAQPSRRDGHACGVDVPRLWRPQLWLPSALSCVPSAQLCVLIDSQLLRSVAAALYLRGTNTGKLKSCLEPHMSSHIFMMISHVYHAQAYNPAPPPAPVCTSCTDQLTRAEAQVALAQGGRCTSCQQVHQAGNYCRVCDKVMLRTAEAAKPLFIRCARRRTQQASSLEIASA